jgi:hypothetical protein
MYSAGEIAQLDQRLLQLARDLRQHPCMATGCRVHRSHPFDGRRNREKPLLGSIVEISLQLTPSLVPCIHDTHARGPDLFELGSHFCMEALVLQGETGRAGHSLDPLFVL